MPFPAFPACHPVCFTEPPIANTAWSNDGIIEMLGEKVSVCAWVYLCMAVDECFAATLHCHHATLAALLRRSRLAACESWRSPSPTHTHAHVPLIRLRVCANTRVDVTGGDMVQHVRLHGPRLGRYHYHTRRTSSVRLIQRATVIPAACNAVRAWAVCLQPVAYVQPPRAQIGKGTLSHSPLASSTTFLASSTTFLLRQALLPSFACPQTVWRYRAALSFRGDAWARYYG